MEKYNFSRIIKILKKDKQLTIDFASGRRCKISTDIKAGQFLSQLISNNDYLFAKMVVSIKRMPTSLIIDKIVFIDVDVETNNVNKVALVSEDIPEEVQSKIWDIVFEDFEGELSMSVEGDNNVQIQGNNNVIKG